MKRILIAGAALIVVMTAVLIMTPRATAPQPLPEAELTAASSSDGTMISEDTAPDGQTASGTPSPTANTSNPATFTGTLEAIDTGCFADGVCSATVDGKVVVVMIGWNRDAVGQIIGVDSIGDLETVIGKTVEVYAAPTDDGGYTLIGSSEYYIKLLP